MSQANAVSDLERAEHQSYPGGGVKRVTGFNDGTQINFSTSDNQTNGTQKSITIDTSHQRIHEGRFFSGGDYNTSVSSSSNYDLLVQSSATEYTHIIFRAGVGGDSEIRIYEDVTFSNAGTAVNTSNHDRTSSKTFSGTVTHTPTITGLGYQINGTMFIAGGVGHNSSGSNTEGFNSEFILGLGKNYLFRVTNISGQTTKMSIGFSAYQPNL